MKKLLFILFCILIASCSARKADKKYEELKVDTEKKIDSVGKSISDTKKVEDSNIKTNSSTKVYDQGETIIRETTYEPSDITKPSIITDENGKKTILENVKKTTKETIKKNNLKTENIFKKDEVVNKTDELKKKDEVKLNKVEKDKSGTILDTKVVDKKAFNVFNLLWLLIPIGLIIVGIYLWKKYRSFIPI
jgi:hypothetical protein